MANGNILIADAVFEGGGVKGIGLVGAVAVAEEKGYQWENLAGTSAGAIVAALLAAGYSATEMKEVLNKLDYNNFKDKGTLDKIPAAGPILSLLFEKGVYEGKFFEDWIRGLLAEKGKRTFSDLVLPEYADDIRYRYNLRVIASDITRGKLLVLPQDASDFGIKPDDLDIASAIRMSMSIPFFYEPVKLLNKETKEESYIVDGGLLSNFPVWLFDTEGVTPQWPTFGFKLVEPEEGKPNKICGPISMLTALFSTMMEAHDARYVDDANYARTIPIPTLGVGTTEFDLSPQRSEELYQSGRKAAKEFFNSWDFQKYLQKYPKLKKEESRGLGLRTK